MVVYHSHKRLPVMLPDSFRMRILCLFRLEMQRALLLRLAIATIARLLLFIVIELSLLGALIRIKLHYS